MADDTVPTLEDIAFAETWFTDDQGECSCRKVGPEVARQRRIMMEYKGKQDDMHRKISGDKATGYPGMHGMITEMYEKDTGKTTTAHKKTEALEVVKTDRDIMKYVYIGVGIVGTLSFLLPLIWDKLFGGAN